MLYPAEINTPSSDSSLIERLHLHVTGAVQGVGFRPFIFNLATELKLNGWVRNDMRGLDIEIEGHRSILEMFITRLKNEKPHIATIKHIKRTSLENTGKSGFKILSSENPQDMQPKPSVLPDLASCPECLNEIQDKNNRRYRYPFTSCTLCGPRWSIIEALPYDRPNTTMQPFPFCPDCQQEYSDPGDRRFHHQANTCPNCGPQLAMWDSQGNVLHKQESALMHAIDALQQGKIVALKGIGGFQLLVDAENEQAVNRLRQRKQRPSKPFALMCSNLMQAQQLCIVNPIEQETLQSAAAPIVLLQRQPSQHTIANSVAPNNPYLGVMLPYSVLHWLILEKFNKPLVCTSGNLSGEPICHDEHEALHRLKHIADLFLVHDRKVARTLDDSVVQVVMNKVIVLRRARGYTPQTLAVPYTADHSVLAVGAHIKNTIALTLPSEHNSTEIMLSAHLGDLDKPQSRDAFADNITNLSKLYRLKPTLIAHDLHPDYHSSQYAETNTNIYRCPVQHHWAHIAASIAEHDIKGKVLGIVWDGVGLGDDHTAWGGEFIIGDLHSYQRVGKLLPFPLPGGDQAARDARRALLGALFILNDANITELQPLIPKGLFENSELTALLSILKRNVNCAVTSSAGRLFDAAASLLGLCQQNQFEGECAMMLQFAAETSQQTSAVTTHYIYRDGVTVIDWRPLLSRIYDGINNNEPVNDLASLFHYTLIKTIIDFSSKFPDYPIVLTGGCFQNRLLLTQAATQLQKIGRNVYWPQQIPANDGGIAFGQAVIGLNKSETPIPIFR